PFTASPRSPRNQHPARRIRYSATAAPNRDRHPRAVLRVQVNAFRNRCREAVSISKTPAAPTAVQLSCARREYKKQTHADRGGKEDLHCTVVPGDDVAECTPNNDGTQYG